MQAILIILFIIELLLIGSRSACYYRPMKHSRIFIISLIIKGLDAFLEVIGGTALFFAGPLLALAAALVNGELIEDPRDLVATTVQHYLPYLWAQSPLFGAIYLLSHGIIKIVLVVALLYKKLWAYPLALIVLALFIVYQMYRYVSGHSLFLVALSAFDAFLILLIANEYRQVKRSLSAKNSG